MNQYVTGAVIKELREKKHMTQAEFAQKFKCKQSPHTNQLIDLFPRLAQMVKNLPAMQETRVQSLGWEDPWRREWQSMPVFLPGESHGQRSLAGHSPWGRKESDTTE